MENQNTETKKDAMDLFGDASGVFGGLLDVMTGASAFGRIMKSPAMMPYFIQVKRNNLQQMIAGFMFHHTHGRCVNNNSEEDKAEAWTLLEQVQNAYRRSLEMLFKQEAETDRFYEQNSHARRYRDRIDEEAKRAAAAHDHKLKYEDANKPHAQGTVAELAAKLGISKSEVRRLKAEGKLEEVLNNYKIS